jgi:hypothetical protein
VLDDLRLEKSRDQVFAVSNGGPPIDHSVYFVRVPAELATAFTIAVEALMKFDDLNPHEIIGRGEFWDDHTREIEHFITIDDCFSDGRDREVPKKEWWGVPIVLRNYLLTHWTSPQRDLKTLNAQRVG